MNISEFYQYSQFATLAYVDYPSGKNTSPGEAIFLADDADRIPASLGEELFNQQGWRIGDFYPTSDPTGFDATLFTNSVTGEKILAIRGTEPDNEAFADLLEADIGEIGLRGMAISQAISMFNYIQRLMAPGTVSDVLQLNFTQSNVKPSTGVYVEVPTGPSTFTYFSVDAEYTGIGLQKRGQS